MIDEMVHAFIARLPRTQRRHAPPAPPPHLPALDNARAPADALRLQTKAVRLQTFAAIGRAGVQTRHVCRQKQNICR